MLQCVEPKPLPKDLDDILNGNPEHGVLYVTFGTCLHANMMADKTRIALGRNSIDIFSPRLWPNTRPKSCMEFEKCLTL